MTIFDDDLIDNHSDVCNSLQPSDTAPDATLDWDDDLVDNHSDVCNSLQLSDAAADATLDWDDDLGDNHSDVCDSLQPSDAAADATLDWRADILRAVHDVFTRDLQAIHTELRTYSLLHSSDGSDILDALERTISAQVRREFF